MRLWHEYMIPVLSRQHLLGQHRECCALRGNGWGKKHSVVNYVFTYTPWHLFSYHSLVMEEMLNRNYKPDQLWFDPLYRGKTCEPYTEYRAVLLNKPIYKEHDEKYLNECLENMRQKGFEYMITRTYKEWEQLKNYNKGEL